MGRRQVPGPTPQADTKSRRRTGWASAVSVVVGGSLLVLATAGPGGGVAEAATGFSVAGRHAAPTSPVQTVVTSVQVARGSGFDRVIFSFDGAQPGYDVEYVRKATTEPAGTPLAVRGEAFLRVQLRPTSTVTPAPQPNLNPNFSRLQHVKGAGDFEALTTYVLGLSGKAPFRVMRLSKPNRLVVDTANTAATLPRTGDAGLSLPLVFTGLTLLLSGLALRVASLQPAGHARRRPFPFPAPAQQFRVYLPATGTGRRRQGGHRGHPAVSGPRLSMPSVGVTAAAVPAAIQAWWPWQRGGSGGQHSAHLGGQHGGQHGGRSGSRPRSRPRTRHGGRPGGQVGGQHRGQPRGQHRRGERGPIGSLSRPAPRHRGSAEAWRPWEGLGRRTGWLGLIERTAELRGPGRSPGAGRVADDAAP
jgi:hypothetical protein